MKRVILLLLLFLTVISLQAQNTIKGTISDKSTGETLIGANVWVPTLNVGAVTDFDGNYTLQVKDGTHNLSISYLGYQAVEREVTVSSGTTQTLNVALKTDAYLEEVLVVADIARDQKTPVAFTNVPTIKIQEEIAAQDLPMVLNSTPGAYATQSGGGEGDARITIRGFSQRNIAILFDGVPVNDMENGRVYWSNWSGLDGVLKTMQVQRGLGYSKLSIPSIGGTVNILTKGIDSKRNVKFSYKNSIFEADFNNNGNEGIFPKTKHQYSLGFSSGRLNNGWGVTLYGMYKHGQTWADGTDFRAGTYFAKVEKEYKKHIFSLSVFGAPQQHGARSFKQRVAYFDKEYAAGLFKGTDEEYQAILDGSAENIEQQIIEKDYIDTTGAEAFGYGLRFNPFWGKFREWDISENGDTIWQKEQNLNVKKNYYHKPQITFRHSWSPTNKFLLSNVAYLSLGNGGGNSIDGSGPDFSTSEGLIDIQRYYDINKTGSIFKTAGDSEYFIRSSVNSHFWTGLLSTASYTLNDNWSFSSGVDFRYYEGYHYREVNDLLGGDYTRIGGDTLRMGDRLDYDNTGFVRWAGVFGLAEYSDSRWSAFVNLSTAMSSYKSVDNYFRYIETPDSTILVNIYSKGTIGNTEYNFNSPEAKTIELPWENVPSFTFKTGASYKLNENMSMFVNGGFLSKAPRFNNVVRADVFSRNDGSVQLYDTHANYANEKIYAGEVGWNYKSPKLSISANAYATQWKNKPLDRLPSIPINPDEPEDSETITTNVNGLGALHLGIEVDASYRVHRMLKVEGLASIGHWQWNTVASYFNPVLGTTTTFDPRGVYVSDAAQLQFGGKIRFEPIKDLYIQARGTWFGKNYAAFSPTDDKYKFEEGDERLTDDEKQPWKMPNYFLLDISAGYYFKIKDVKSSIRFNLLNALNAVYLSDATNNDSFRE